MNLSVHRHKTLRVKNKFKKRGGGGKKLKIVSTKSTNTHLLQRPGLVSSRYFAVQTKSYSRVTSCYLSPGPQSTQIKAKQNDNADIEKNEW